jgi:hypothetical protein
MLAAALAVGGAGLNDEKQARLMKAFHGFAEIRE